jgi:hypothetical protein
MIAINPSSLSIAALLTSSLAPAFHALERAACAAQAQARDFHTITIQDRPPKVHASKPARSTNESWRRQGKRPGRRS